MKTLSRLLILLYTTSILIGCGSKQPNIDITKSEFCPKCYETTISPISINCIKSSNHAIGDNELREKIAPLLQKKAAECLNKLGYQVTEKIKDEQTDHQNANLTIDILSWKLDKSKSPKSCYVTVRLSIENKEKDVIWEYESRVNNEISSNPSTELPYWLKGWSGSIFEAISIVDLTIWATPYIHNALTSEDKELLSLGLNSLQIALSSLPYGPSSQKHHTDKDDTVRIYF